MFDATLPDTQADASAATPPKKAYQVRGSKVHGRGVFALRDIHPGERIIQYRGREITWEEAQERAEASGAPHNHTFFFSLSNGNVIDGGDHGNVARYINHSCEPNCEAIEEDDGRIFIFSVHEICAGDELSYSYPLIYEGRHTAAIKKAFACRCGAPNCTGTMLAPKPRKRKTRQAAVEQAAAEQAAAEQAAAEQAEVQQTDQTAMPEPAHTDCAAAGTEPAGRPAPLPASQADTSSVLAL